MKDLEVYKKIVDLLKYSDKYILSSFSKSEMSLKIHFNDALYNLLENVIRANVNKGNIRLKHQREMIVNIHFLDYYIEEITRKKIISNKKYGSFIAKLNIIRKLLNGWINSEKSR